MPSQVYRPDPQDAYPLDLLAGWDDSDASDDEFLAEPFYDADLDGFADCPW
jgi:hypothetical protein